MSLNTNFSIENDPQWELSLAKKGDGVGIEEVRKQAWIATYPDPAVGLTLEDIDTVSFGSPEKIEKWEEAFEKQGESNRIWVVRDEEEIIGFAAAERTKENQELRAIYVLPSHHGQGVGKELMQTALSWLGDEEDISVWVFSHNEAAIKYYKKYGFVENGNSGSLDVNHKQIPDIEMVRKRNS